jgi:hypothetical protein
MKISRISEGILYEAGMARVLEHVKQHPFAVLTAFRANNTLKHNRLLNKKLEQQLRTIGAGAVKVLGHWQESPDGMWFGRNFDEMNPEELIDTIEESYFIPMPENMEFDDFRKWTLNIINNFSQDAAVISDGIGIYLIDKTGDLIKIGNKITVDKIAQAYSTMRWRRRGAQPKSATPDQPILRTFVFEGTMRPSNNAHKLLLSKRNIFWV